MWRCLQLAKLGEGRVAPNPMVGAVLVYNDRIIGEGYHEQFGKSHAEVNCINQVKDKSLLPQATMYVSLEPCSHFGKTPPCSNLILESKIDNLIVGITDNSSKVNGNGIAQLRNAGVHITYPVLEQECYAINRFFFTANKWQRPYVILKWAQSADGFIAPINNEMGKISWISNPLSQQLVHKWRAGTQAIMVGTQTVINDNPQLTTRNWKGSNPVRIIMDRNLRIPSTSSVFDDSSRTILYTSNHASLHSKVEQVVWEAEHITFKNILQDLYTRNIHSLLVEGGTTLLQNIISNELWDEARIFVSKKKIGQGVKAPEISGVLQQEDMLGDDQLNIYYPTYMAMVNR